MKKSKSDNVKEINLDQWVKEAQKNFGEDTLQWEFICPSCGHVQKGEDFLPLCVDTQNAFNNCIGRFNDKKVGCNWSLGGLFQIHKTVVIKNAKPIPVFEFNTK